MSLILKLNDLIEGEVIKRPSKHIKTPYVADIQICSTSTMILGHTASLGCCGLADVTSKAKRAARIVASKAKRLTNKLAIENALKQIIRPLVILVNSAANSLNFLKIIKL